MQIDKMKSLTLTPNIEDIVVARAVSTNFDSVSEFSVFESTNSNSPKRMMQKYDFGITFPVVRQRSFFASIYICELVMRKEKKGKKRRKNVRQRWI